MPKKLISYKLQAKQGFTLIETMIYMGLLAMILLVITNLMITTSVFSQEETARIEIQQTGRYQLEKIVRDLENTTAISTPSDASPTNNLVVTTSGGQISYQLSGNNLTRQTISSTENTNSNQVKIDSVNFRRIGNAGGKPTIEITINVNYIGQVEGNRNISQTFTTTYSLK